MCMTVDPVPVSTGGEDDSGDDNDSGSILKFGLMVFVLCLSYLI